jgi:hypothetical protein
MQTYGPVTLTFCRFRVTFAVTPCAVQGYGLLLDLKAFS